MPDIDAGVGRQHLRVELEKGQKVPRMGSQCIIIRIVDQCALEFDLRERKDVVRVGQKIMRHRSLTGPDPGSRREAGRWGGGQDDGEGRTSPHSPAAAPPASRPAFHLTHPHESVTVASVGKHMEVNGKPKVVESECNDQDLDEVEQRGGFALQRRGY
jgi:hypothetical protein